MGISIVVEIEAVSVMEQMQFQSGKSSKGDFQVCMYGVYRYLNNSNHDLHVYIGIRKAHTAGFGCWRLGVSDLYPYIIT